MRDANVRRASRFHRGVYVLTGGAIGGRLVDNDMLLLTTCGAQTGRLHTVPLLFLTEGAALVVIGSYGGRDRHPAWYTNLVEEPTVTVRTRRRIFTAKARTVGGAQRTRLWTKAIDAYPGYETYQSRTDREIPVVILERVVQEKAGMTSRANSSNPLGS